MKMGPISAESLAAAFGIVPQPLLGALSTIQSQMLNPSLLTPQQQGSGHQNQMGSLEVVNSQQIQPSNNSVHSIRPNSQQLPQQAGLLPSHQNHLPSAMEMQPSLQQAGLVSKQDIAQNSFAQPSPHENPSMNPSALQLNKQQESLQGSLVFSPIMNPNPSQPMFQNQEKNSMGNLSPFGRQDSFTSNVNLFHQSAGGHSQINTNSKINTDTQRQLQKSRFADR